MRRKDTQVDTKGTGKNIEKFMRQAEITVSDFARELDVTDNAVRNYIKGFNLPDTVKMYLICKLLNVDIRDIIVERCVE